MAVNINNAFVGTPPMDGGVYFNAPVDTPLPKTATEKLNDAFKDHGAVGPDGFNVQPTRSSDTEKMFGGGDWVDLQSDYTEEVTITLLEDDNEAVIESIFGADNVVVTPGKEGTQKTIFHTKQRLPIKTHVLKAVDGDKVKTYIVPRGRITTAEKTPDVHSASTKFNITIKAFPYIYSEGGKDREVYVIELRDDGRPSTSGGSVNPAGSRNTGGGTTS